MTVRALRLSVGEIAPRKRAVDEPQVVELRAGDLDVDQPGGVEGHAARVLLGKHDARQFDLRVGGVVGEQANLATLELGSKIRWLW